MANSIDLIVSKEAQKQLDDLYKSLTKTHEEVVAISKLQLSFNGGQSPKSVTDLNEKIKDQAKIQAQLEKQIEKNRLAEIRLQQAREKAIDKYNADLAKQEALSIKASEKIIAQKDKEFAAFKKQFEKYEADLEKQVIAEQKASQKARELIRKKQQDEEKLNLYRRQEFDKNNQKLLEQTNKEISAYNRIQNSVNLLSKTYKDLAIRKELGNTLSAGEEKNLAQITARLTQYQNALKKVDANMGNHQRNVGNYASAFNPLNNSINQLSREMPAFANSVQTGFMAISNNLPIFFDAMGGIINQNKELQAQGQPTQSVLKQLASSVFSLGTALSVGVTLLTIYGKDLVEWASSLFGASEAMKSLTESQKEFNQTRLTGQKDAQSEIIELKKYLAVVKDEKLSREEREIALKKLKQEYPFYFKNLTDEQILLGQTKDAQNALNLALEKRKQVEKATEINVANKQRLIDLEKEVDLQETILKRAKMPKVNLSTGLKQTDPLEIMVEQKKLNSLLETRKNYYDTIIKNDGLIIKLKKETIGLEYQEEKVKKESNKQKTKLSFDYIESEYALRLSLLNRQKEFLAEELNNENLSFEGKILARQKYSEKLIEILNLEASKEKAISLIKYNEDLERNNLAYVNKELTAIQYAENITVLNKRYSNETKKIDVDTSNSFNKITNDSLTFYAKIQKEKTNIARNTEKILTDLEIKKLNRIKDNEENTLQIRQNAFEEMLALSHKELALAEIREKAMNPDKIDEISAKYKNLKNDLDNLVSPLKNAQKETDKWIESMGSKKTDEILSGLGLSSTKMFIDFDKNGQSTFDKLIEGADGLKERFQVNFVAMAEVAKEVFSIINKNSQANYEAEYSRLEQQKNISIAFAGSSATAKAEIERQYEEKRKSIQRRQAEAEKKQAMFNIAINTAQAVMATLGKGGFFASPLAMVVAAAGAAQLAMVAAQEIPAFAEGGIHEGGKMLINDAKGSKYQETVVTPDGKIRQFKGRNKVVDAPKGTQIFTPDQWSKQINNMLLKNNIQPLQTNQTNGINKDDLESVFRKYSGSNEVAIDINENGFKKMISSNGRTREILNSRLTTKGRIV